MAPCRTIWWLLGLGTVLLVTATGIEGYGLELFSIHMIQHMVLNVLAPVFLVLGAPVSAAAGPPGRIRTARGRPAGRYLAAPYQGRRLPDCVRA